MVRFHPRAMSQAKEFELVDEVLRHCRKDLLGQVDSWFSDLEAEIKMRLQEVNPPDGLHDGLHVSVSKAVAEPGKEPLADDVKCTPREEKLEKLEVVENLEDVGVEVTSATFQTAYEKAKAVASRKKFKKAHERASVYVFLSEMRAAVIALVNASFFDIFFALVIISNAVYLGVQVDSIDPASPSGPAASTFVVQLTYAVVFSLEVVLRCIAAGPREYVCGLDWAWNLLDISVVLSSWTVILLDFLFDDSDTGVGSSIRIVRIIRASRLLRILRTVWVIRFVGALRTLVSSLVDTLRSLFWALLLLFLIMYVFGSLVRFVEFFLRSILRVREPGCCSLQFPRVLLVCGFWSSCLAMRVGGFAS